MLYSAIQQKKM